MLLPFVNGLAGKKAKTIVCQQKQNGNMLAGAGTYTLFSTGDGLPAVYHRNQKVVRDFDPVSLKVAQTPPNTFGLYDMHGNVEEWCLDWYAPYSAEKQKDPAGPLTGEFRVTRGGSHHTPEKYLRSANRLAMLPEDKHSQTGFRIVEADTRLNVSGTSAPVPFNQKSVENTSIKWKKVSAITPMFLPPIPFVVRPVCDSNTPFYLHNHQPAVTWCDNGDLLAIWFSANEENGRGMVVLGSRLRARAH